MSAAFWTRIGGALVQWTLRLALLFVASQMIADHERIRPMHMGATVVSAVYNTLIWRAP